MPQPPPQVLELAASKVADSLACGHSGVIVVVVLAYVLLPQLTALPGLQGAASASSSSSASSSDEPSSEEGAASSSSALSRR